MTKTILFGIIVATVMILGVFATSQNQALSQEMEEESELAHELGKHLFDTETISLTGKLQPGDFKLLMDITGYTSESGHVAMKFNKALVRRDPQIEDIAHQEQV